MPNAEAIRWFKANFSTDIQREIQGTPYTVDFFTAIACQETGYIWDTLRKRLPTPEVLRLCVGDTLDSTRGRSAFPRTRAELESHAYGTSMFALAHTLLVEMARYIPGYASAARNANKFCHGFGIFQYDLQFFQSDPSYFLEQKWCNFAESLRKAITVLDDKLRLLRSRDQVPQSNALTDHDLIKVAIAYNRGSYDPAKGLKQGHQSADGVYYGEAIERLLRLAHQTPVTETIGNRPEPAHPRPQMIVNVNTTLKLRSTPDTRNDRNVIASLSKGHVVTPIGAAMINGFWEIETDVRGNTLKGFVSGRYLKNA